MNGEFLSKIKEKANSKWTIFVVAFLLGMSLASTAITVVALSPNPQTGNNAANNTSTTMNAGFTYQGRLDKNGEPITGQCEMAFRLYDQESDGVQVGNPITKTADVNNGLFNVVLDFGSEAFTGEVRWLDIQVKCADDIAFEKLGRTKLTAAPYALYAISAGELQGNPITTTNPSSGQILIWNGSAWEPMDPLDTTYIAGNQLVLTDTTFSVVEGAGSDLDADFLDGYHANEFVTRSALGESGFHNLILNSGFEFFRSGDDTSPDYWTAIDEDYPVTGISRFQPGYERESAVSLLDASTSKRLCLKQEIFANGELPERLKNHVVSFSAWARKNDDSGLDTGEVSITDNISTTAIALQDTYQWYRISATHKIAPGATGLSVILCSTKTNVEVASYRFDAIMLTEGPIDHLFQPNNILDQLAGNSVFVDQLIADSFIQFPIISGGAPPAAACDTIKEAGRVVVRIDGPPDIYICNGSGWISK